jgi:hypothetical protein
MCASMSASCWAGEQRRQAAKARWWESRRNRWVASEAPLDLGKKAPRLSVMTNRGLSATPVPRSQFLFRHGMRPL